MQPTLSSLCRAAAQFNLSSGSSWFPATNFMLTNSFLFIPTGKATNRAMFFRAMRS